MLKLGGKYKPFVKRVGGKRQLLEQFESLYPDFNPQKNSYYEPFLGGGAVFFELRNIYGLNFKAYLCDINAELINTYNVIKTDTTNLIKELKKYNYDKDFFMEIRERDRDIEFLEKRSPIERAARFIYLNRTCFNGMYRVNGKGYFNVPFGDYANPKICDEEGLCNAREALQNTTIICGNFYDVEDKVNSGDFVYFDPPYDTLSTTANFTDYIEGGFGWEDQIRLKECFDIVTKKGGNAMLSNHNTERIQQLYENYDKHIVSAKRMINSDASKRGAVEEIVVLNYKK